MVDSEKIKDSQALREMSGFFVFASQHLHEELVNWVFEMEIEPFAWNEVQYERDRYDSEGNER